MLSADSSGTSMNANRQSRPASMPPENVNSTLAAPEQAAKVATGGEGRELTIDRRRRGWPPREWR